MEKIERGKGEEKEEGDNDKVKELEKMRELTF